MSDSYNKPVEFDSSAERAGQAAQQAAQEMEEAVKRAAIDSAAAAEAAAQRMATDAKQAGPESSAKVDDLVEELNRVGSQVADQAKSAWESEQRKKMQDEMVKSFSSVATAVEDQFKRLAANPDTQRFLGKVEEATSKVVEQARGSKTLQEAAEAVLKGLNSAAVAIEKWLGQQQAGAGTPAAPAAPSPDDPQEIMIQRPAAPPAPTTPAPTTPPPSEGSDRQTYV
jgi:hypothetical protein